MGLKILLIDDEPLLLQTILKADGYKVDVALNGLIGIELLYKRQILQDPYDLIILDIQMPVMDGWTTLRNIRSEPNFEKLNVIVLTADDLEESYIKGFNSGADSYITKPISAKRFQALIGALARKIRTQSNLEENLNHYKFSKLSKREKEVAALVCKGLTSKHVGELLSITEITVKNHLAKVYKRLGIASRIELILMAQEVKKD